MYDLYFADYFKDWCIMGEVKTINFAKLVTLSQQTTRVIFILKLAVHFDKQYTPLTSTYAGLVDEQVNKYHQQR